MNRSHFVLIQALEALSNGDLQHPLRGITTLEDAIKISQLLFMAGISY